MVYVLIAFGIGFVVLGYYLMGKLDRFLHRGSKVRSPKRPPDLILFGTVEKPGDFSGYPLFPGLFVERIASPGNLGEFSEFRALAAIGTADVDNLLLCSMARKRNRNCLLIALCNNPLYENMYRDFKVDHLLAEKPSGKLLVDLVEGMKK